MKIYIAKHYWKDGENATWEHHSKIDTELFEYIKKNYHKFVQNKPNMIKQNGYYVYICYEDSKDIYNRSITNATFFISKKVISKELCEQEYQNLELNLAGNNKINLKILTIALLIIIGFFATIFIKNDTKKPSKEILIEENEQIDINEKSKIVQNIAKEKVVDSKWRNNSKTNNKYAPFIKNWNEQIDKYFKNYKEGKEFKLSISSDKKTINKLNELIKPFKNIDEKMLNKTENENIQNKYREFFDKYSNDKNITLEIGDNPQKLQNKLQEITEEKTITDIVKIILKMNNMSIFEMESSQHEEHE